MSTTATHDALRPVSDIPNAVGFKLWLVAPNGATVPAYVDTDLNGCHVCKDARNNNYRLCTTFAGWKPRL